MKKVLLPLSVILLSSTSSVSIISLTTNNKTFLKHNNNNKTSLTDVLKNQQIGIIENGDDVEIKEAIFIQNPEIDIFEIDVKRLSNYLAQVTPKKDSKIYQDIFPGVTVNFEIKEKKHLDKVVEISNLGIIEDNTEEDLLNTFFQLNSSTKIKRNEVKLQTNTIGRTTVVLTSVKNGPYKGDVLIKFNLKPVKISRDLNNIDLDFLQDNLETTIMNKVIDKNPNIVASELFIDKNTVTENSAIVKVKTASKRYIENDELKLEFWMPELRLTNEFKIDKVDINAANQKEFLSALLKSNNNLDIKEINIVRFDQSNFYVQAKKESRKYVLEEPIKIQYSLPEKVNLDYIGNFKLTNFWTYEVDNQGNLVSGKILEYITKIIQNEVGSEKEINSINDFKVQVNPKNKNQLIVRANAGSKNLIGNLSITITDKYKISKDVFQLNDIKPTSYDINNNAYTQSLPEKIFDDLINKNYKEIIFTNLEEAKQTFVNDFNSLYNLSSNKYKYKHNNNEYYKEMKFSRGFNLNYLQYLGDQEIKLNFLVPKYNNVDLTETQTDKLEPIYIDNNNKIKIKDRTIVAFGSSENETYNGSGEVLNKSSTGIKDKWGATPEIEIGRIAYKSDFNSKNAEEFLKNYQLKLSYGYIYNYGAEYWIWGTKWEGSNYFETDFNKDTTFEHVLNNTHLTNVNSQTIIDRDFFTKVDGNYNGGRKAAVGYKLWLKDDEDNNELIIKLQLATWWSKKTSSGYSHRCFIKIRPEWLVVQTRI